MPHETEENPMWNARRNGYESALSASEC